MDNKTEDVDCRLLTALLKDVPDLEPAVLAWLDNNPSFGGAGWGASMASWLRHNPTPWLRYVSLQYRWEGKLLRREQR